MKSSRTSLHTKMEGLLNVREQIKGILAWTVPAIIAYIEIFVEFKYTLVLLVQALFLASHHKAIGS